MGEIILCAAAAMVGAGFASGREIMQFFSRYGAFSWTLVLLASCVTALMTCRMLAQNDTRSATGKRLLILFSLAVGGGMTAAAGELWALTVPLSYARTVGRLITLMVCLRLADGSLRGMAQLGKILLPLLLAAMILCVRVPGSFQCKTSVTVWEYILAVVNAVGYCGLNGMTADGVLRGPWSRKERNTISLGCGLLTALLLGLGNAALLPHAGVLSDAALPTVILLRAYGKTGYYLAATVLYLATSTTLIAVLRSLLTLSAPYIHRHKKPLVCLAVLSMSLLGFQDIVGMTYPALGWTYLILLLFPSREFKNKKRVQSA